MNKFKKGFTMIELLVVIAVIGVLAVAVLSAINPIEQINKGRDTGRRSDSGEVLGAVERYYASIGWYPWEIESPVTPVAVPMTNVDELTDGVAENTILVKMVATNEIKAGLQSRLEGLSPADKLKLYYEGVTTTSGAYICFTPKSKAFQTEAASRCADGTKWASDSPSVEACPVTAAACKAAGTCMICLP